MTERGGSGVFVVTLEGVEDAAEGPLTVLAFAVGGRNAEAEARAARELASDGFRQIQVLRSGEVTAPEALPEDFREALAKARRYGCWLIIYDAP